MRLLLEIQSEAKLQRLLRSLGTQQEARLLRHALEGSLSAMQVVFRQKCIQHAPHINYMQMPPLARVACASLLAKVADVKERVTAPLDAEQLDVVRALTTLLLSIHRLEQTALIYIDARHIEKFVGEHLLRQEHVPSLLSYMRWLATAAGQQLRNHDARNDGATNEPHALAELLDCLDALLQQQCIWWALNASTGDALRAELLEVLALVARRKLQHTIFYQRHRLHNAQNWTQAHAEAVATATAEAAPQAIFIAKLIETQMDMESLDSRGCGDGGMRAADEFGSLPVATGSELAPLQVPLVSEIPLAGHLSFGQTFELCDMQLFFCCFAVLQSLIASIGTSLLRTHQFYAYAVTPYELIQQQQATTAAVVCVDGKLPTIPVDSLSDVDILSQFVKR